nr:sigma-70 family RNA polymerase sigma factor [uncultured Caproiciproducens sp.]
MEDKKIILLMENKPADGLYEIIKKYRSFVAAITGRILHGNEQDVEECINDTFLSVWKAFGSNNHQIVNLKGYLACAARNTAINRYRQLAKRNVIDIDEINIAEENDMLLEFENRNNAIVLQELIAALDEPDREIFIRKYFLFERIKDIAVRMDLDEIHVKNRLYCGKQKLRKQLKERSDLCETV